MQYDILLSGGQVHSHVLQYLLQGPVAQAPHGWRAEGTSTPAAPAYLHYAADGRTPVDGYGISGNGLSPHDSGCRLTGYDLVADIGKIALPLAQVDAIHVHVLSHELPCSVSPHNHGGPVLFDQGMRDELQEAGPVVGGTFAYDLLNLSHGDLSHGIVVGNTHHLRLRTDGSVQVIGVGYHHIIPGKSCI